MERITRRLSMHKTPCLKCKEYKSCNAILLDIIQKQNNQLEKLRRMTGQHESSPHDSTQPNGKLKKTVQGSNHQ